MISIDICFHKKIRGRLAGRVRTVGIIGRRLIEKRIRVIVQAPIYLVRRNMKELLSLLKTSIRQLPGFLGTIEHHCCPQHVGLYKHFRILDASVHMALRRKMHHPVNLILRKNCSDCFLVTDVRFHECIVLSVLNVF